MKDFSPWDYAETCLPTPCTQVADFGLSRELNFSSRLETASYGTVTHSVCLALHATLPLEHFQGL